MDWHCYPSSGIALKWKLGKIKNELVYNSGKKNKEEHKFIQNKMMMMMMMISITIIKNEKKCERKKTI